MCEFIKQWWEMYTLPQKVLHVLILIAGIALMITWWVQILIAAGTIVALFLVRTFGDVLEWLFTPKDELHMHRWWWRDLE